MDRKSNKSVRRYLLVFLVFASVFTVFMYTLARYENTVKRQQMIGFLEKHPEMEAEIISMWGKPKKDYLFDKTEDTEKYIQIIEEKYGYDFYHMMPDYVLWLFWGAGIALGALLIVMLGYVDRRREKRGDDSADHLLELYECLEQFRKGDFGAIPGKTDDSEEWMKLWESVRELGVYFETLKERLREEEDSTKSLITDISHQLKTPLASLRMSHELVVSDGLSEEERLDFQMQEEREIDKLEMLLNELVNLSRLESRMIQIRPVAASLKATITEAVSRIYMKARKKDIEIQVEMEGDIEVCHDARWTEEALTNVLDNAVKYSDEKTVVTVRVTPLIRNVLIEIEDEGFGLEADEISRIYQRFYRGNKAKNQVKEGAGVGLYLTRMILERQGGTISAKRKIEAGTVFKITLPW